MSVVFVLLVLAWAIVLLPAWLRSRAERGSGDSIVDFRRRLSVLNSWADGAGGSDAPRRVAPQQETASVLRARTRRAKKRRRDIFMGLLASMAGSLVLGFLPGMRVLWYLHLALDGLFVLYVLLLLRIRHGQLPRPAAAEYYGEDPQDLALAYTQGSQR